MRNTLRHHRGASRIQLHMYKVSVNVICGVMATPRAQAWYDRISKKKKKKKIYLPTSKMTYDFTTTDWEFPALHSKPHKPGIHLQLKLKRLHSCFRHVQEKKNKKPQSVQEITETKADKEMWALLYRKQL